VWRLLACECRPTTFLQEKGEKEISGLCSLYNLELKWNKSTHQQEVFKAAVCERGLNLLM